MHYLVKAINIISAIFVAIGLCGACSIDFVDPTPISTFFKVYGVLILLLVIGAFGLKVVDDPNRYFSFVYASYYGIVNTVYATVHKMYKNWTVKERFECFFDEGLDVYDECYYI